MEAASLFLFTSVVLQISLYGNRLMNFMGDKTVENDINLAASTKPPLYREGDCVLLVGNNASIQHNKKTCAPIPNSRQMTALIARKLCLLSTMH